MAQDPHELNDAPLLQQLRGSDPFVVPEGFFERFPHQVQAAATQQSRPVNSRGTIYWLFWPAGVVVAMLAVLFIWGQLGPEQTGTTLAQNSIVPYDVELEELDHPTDLLLDEEGPTLAEVHLPVTDDELLGYIAYEEIALDLLIEEL